MSNIAPASSIVRRDIIAEHWREYDIPGRPRPYRIEKPVALFTREGGTTHRVLDAEGVVHCVPAPTATSGVVLRWKSDAALPVEF